MIWRARFAVRRPRTVSTKSVLASATRIGLTGTPRTCWQSSPAESCHNERPRRTRTATPGQTVVVIGGSAGIGFETARVARAEGAKVIFTGWDPERLQRAATELGALSNVAFD